MGNRIASVSGVPGAPSTYYAGAASGGVWKSTDGGNRWDPIFDKQAVAAIGAIAVAPSDPSVIWVGKGEAWAIRDSDVMGNGVYLSTDSGNNWTHVGLDETGHRPAAGARSLSHHRPGAALGARALRQCKHRLLRASLNTVHLSIRMHFAKLRHLLGAACLGLSGYLLILRFTPRGFHRLRLGHHAFFKNFIKDGVVKVFSCPRGE